MRDPVIVEGIRELQGGGGDAGMEPDLQAKAAGRV